MNQHPQGVAWPPATESPRCFGVGFLQAISVVWDHYSHRRSDPHRFFGTAQTSRQTNERPIAQKGLKSAASISSPPPMHCQLELYLLGVMRIQENSLAGDGHALVVIQRVRYLYQRMHFSLIALCAQFSQNTMFQSVSRPQIRCCRTIPQGLCHLEFLLRVDISPVVLCRFLADGDDLG